MSSSDRRFPDVFTARPTISSSASFSFIRLSMPHRAVDIFMRQPPSWTGHTSQTGNAVLSCLMPQRKRGCPNHGPSPYALLRHSPNAGNMPDSWKCRTFGAQEEFPRVVATVMYRESRATEAFSADAGSAREFSTSWVTGYVQTMLFRRRRPFHKGALRAVRAQLMDGSTARKPGNSRGLSGCRTRTIINRSGGGAFEKVETHEGGQQYDGVNTKRRQGLCPAFFCVWFIV